MTGMFDRIYVIHLPDAKRRMAMDTELRRMGLAATYLHAKPAPRQFSVPNMRRNPRVEFAVSLSHIKAVVRALESGGPALFLEDDVRFLCGPERLRQVIAELPADWDVLYLGGHPRGPTTQATPSLVRVSTFSFAEAYALNGKALRPFLDFWLDRISQPDAMFDLVLGEFAAANHGYCAYPVITEQAPLVSHISGKVDSKSNLLLKGWQVHRPPE